MKDYDALRGTIELHGWALQYVPSPEPERCVGYTAGLTLRGLPEYVVFGLRADEASIVLEIAAEHATAGAGPQPGEFLVGVLGLALHARALDDTSVLERAHDLPSPHGPVRAIELVPVRDPDDAAAVRRRGAAPLR